MKILVSGSSGFIGGAMVKRLSSAGHQVVRLVRSERAAEGGAIVWDPFKREVDNSRLGEVDAVVHLAGRSIGEGRWSGSAKKEMVESRTIPTQFLAEMVAGMSRKPELFLSASAVGYYGDREEELLTEESGSGEGFLAGLCVAWEKACEPARASSIRTINLRIGMVLSARGGALPQMALPFRFGVGGKLGSGKQYMSWVTLEDLLAVIEFALTCRKLSGPVNAVAPNPVSNAEFTRALARALHRPALFAAPAFVLKGMLGEKADALLLSGARVVPEKLLTAGFRFANPELAPALERIFSNTD